MGRIHPRQHWDGLYSPPPGNSCALPRLKSQIRPRIGPGCGCRGLGSGWVERWGARRDVDRWLPRGAGARAALGRLVLTSSRKLLHRSPVKVAVPATNRVGLRLPGGGWAVGGALERWWTSSSGQHDETCTGGRRGCVCARAWRRRLDGPADEKWRPLLPLHSKVGQQGAPAEPRRHRTHPAPASRRRSASAASHTARSSHSPSAAVRCRAHPRLPASRCAGCALGYGVVQVVASVHVHAIAWPSPRTNRWSLSARSSSCTSRTRTPRP